jgi:NAD(P)-dependent dehydrogenase (short-subunit alcohol dehydrogenase family)
MSTWLITGCSTGLGRALAEAVLARGDNAIVTPPPSPPWKACPDHSARNWSRWASP